MEKYSEGSYPKSEEEEEEKEGDYDDGIWCGERGEE